MVVTPVATTIVVGGRLLHHHPHGANVIARMAPVALCVDIAKAQLLGHAALDARNPVRDLAGHEFDAAQRTLVIEENARRGVQAEALAIIYSDPMAV